MPLMCLICRSRRLQERVAELEPLEERLASVGHEHGLKLLEKQEEQKQAEDVHLEVIRSLRAEIARLHKSEKDNDVTVARLKEEVTELNKRFRTEEAARRMLLAQSQELMQYKIEAERNRKGVGVDGQAFIAQKKVEKLQDALAAAEVRSVAELCSRGGVA
eukprot:m.356556 g.356556  ORF g.356556 m.356556 type:complete len:161 (+) comp19931_c0_seq14:59-541(+)